MAGMAMSQVPLSRILSPCRAYVSQGRPKITCSDPNFAKKIGTKMMIPWTLTGTDRAIVVISDRLRSAVLILQSGCFHPMFNCLATPLLLTQMSDPPLMSMGSSCLCIISMMCGATLPYRNSMYQAWSFRPEKAELWAIPIFFGVPRVLAATSLFWELRPF